MFLVHRTLQGEHIIYYYCAKTTKLYKFDYLFIYFVGGRNGAL